MKLSGWGNYPIIDASVVMPRTLSDARALFEKQNFSGIARGLGRSYGDSALSETIVSSSSLDHLLEFNQANGELHCSAGVSLSALLKIFVPRGWFLPVTPGTQFVTVGGAIASDVHGKNHHVHGCFSEHISSIQLLTADGNIVKCSKEVLPELFFATCGGMGLTGIILSATFKLKSIESSYLETTTIKTGSLEDTYEQFEAQQNIPYSVAWIDCLTSGKRLGRSLLTVGKHACSGGLEVAEKGKLAVPFNMPSILLNSFSVTAFNMLYYNQQWKRVADSKQHYDKFFYPLDGLLNWNRIYGKKGFTQYQFVLPKEAGLEGMQVILKRIASSGLGSFLSVLKALGQENQNYLSFPRQGYTLALDFKLQPNLFKLLDELDRMVLDYGGRIYLAKDARMSEATFKQSYPKWELFQEIRARYKANEVFQSLQSKRLGI